jgi:hypothetical protein
MSIDEGLDDDDPHATEKTTIHHARRIQRLLRADGRESDPAVW